MTIIMAGITDKAAELAEKVRSAPDSYSAKLLILSALAAEHSIGYCNGKEFVRLKIEESLKHRVPMAGDT
jgi:hypothetical protein